MSDEKKKDNARRMSHSRRSELIVQIMLAMFPDGIFQRPGGNNGDVSTQLLNAYNFKYEEVPATRAIIIGVMDYMVKTGMAEATKTPTSYKSFKLAPPKVGDDDDGNDVPVVTVPSLEPLVARMDEFIKQVKKANQGHAEQIGLVWTKVDRIESLLEAICKELNITISK